MTGSDRNQIPAPEAASARENDRKALDCGPFVVRAGERTVGPFVHHAAAVEWAQRNQDRLGFYVVAPLVQPWRVDGGGPDA